MSEIIMLNVQKWIYERGNYQIVLENAWNIGQNLKVYSQERITVNGECIRDKTHVSKASIFWTTVFEDTVIDEAGELILKVQYKSGIMSVTSRLLIDEEKQDWTESFAIKWMGGKGEWPQQDEYEI